MKVIVYPSVLSGIAGGIPSKSYLHRLMFCAAISKGETTINAQFSEAGELSHDIKATISAISLLGKGAEITKGAINLFDLPKSKSADVNESGSTFRFLLPIAAAFSKDEITINGSSYLASRPLSPLYEQLVKKGAEISQKGEFPMRVKGPLRGGIYTLPGGISSQFISGLLFALPLCNEDSEIHIEGVLQSQPYVDITLECLKMFGIKIENTKSGYFIPGNQEYISPCEVECECDYSNAAFFLTAGALSDKYTGVSGLNPLTRQGDSAIVPILESFGGIKKIEKNEISFKKGRLDAIEIDASNIPDLVPVLSLAASLAEGITHISKASRLRFKESDRLKSSSDLINRLGGRIVEEEDGLVIQGVGLLRGGEVSSYNDHRIAMTAAVAACSSKDAVVINGFEAVNKSYPGFLRDFERLGGKYKITEE